VSNAACARADRRHPDHQELRLDGLRMLSLADAAAHLNCSVDTVRKLLAAGVLRSVRYTARVQRIPERCVAAVLRGVTSRGAT
jgi:excisionase family DNA binding protein